MTRIQTKRFIKIFSTIISIIIIVIVFSGGFMHLFAIIGLYKDEKQQEKHIENLQSNPQSSIDEQDFASYNLNANPSINQIQSIATHNSYKKKMPSFYYGIGIAFSEVFNLGMHKQFAHSTLTDQLNNGVRGLELDIRYQSDDFYAYHDPIFEQRTHAPKWELLLEELFLWSTNNPNHIMINVIIELKNDNKIFNPSYKKMTKSVLQKFDNSISEIMGDNKIISPSDLIRNNNSLNEMVENNDWPDYYQTKGKFMFLLHSHDEYTDKFISLNPDLQSQNMVPMITSGNLEKYINYASVILHNEPDVDKIRELIHNNYMVRTRMDDKTVYDKQRARRALESGAQIVTTDFEQGRLYPENDYTAYVEDNYTIRLSPAFD